MSTDTLFNDKNLIILKNADTILTELAEPLTNYYKSPNPNSILLVELAKLDKRWKFSKTVAKNAIQVDCSALYDRPKPWLRLPPWESPLTKWVCLRCKKYKKIIQPQVAYFLTECVGNNLKSIDSQLQKIATYIKEIPEITEEHVEKLVYNSKKINVFDLLNAVSERKMDVSLKLCRQVFKNGLQAQDGGTISDSTHIALQIQRLLHYRFKQIWQLGISGNSSSISEFAKKQVSSYTKNFSRKKLIFVWKKLLETEYAIKTSRLDPSSSIEQIIFHIVGI